ncbi:MAG: hypothetical protein JKY98_10300 [Gammaproteobacteria bacterium]|nr:hypothetical protein [Gammaproteobacteria bacterium]
MSKVTLLITSCVAMLVVSIPVGAQNPVKGAARTEMVRNIRPFGQPVVPIFEGWYPKEDGSYDLCYGFHNLNTKQTIDLPLGPDNYIEPARFDGVQPTHFDPVPMTGDLRYFCVFTVNVPADFGDQDVTWTLRIDGQEYSVPGHTTHLEYRIRALELPSIEAVAPLVKFIEPKGPQGSGRSGVRAGPVRARVGSPLPLKIEVTEPEGMMDRDSGFEAVTARWAKHQGPGEVVFQHTDDATSVRQEVGLSTMATFSEPGDYVLRIQAFEGLRQRWQVHCCWTNAFLEVTVTP